MRLFPAINFSYKELSFLEEAANTTRITGAVELKNPKTKMKMIGKRKLKITAEGLLKIDLKLALAIESIPVN